MTDLEILKTAIDTLDGISVPVTLTEKIGIPIYNSTSMLKKLYNAIVERLHKQLEEKEAEEAKGDSEETEVEFKVVKEDEENENVEQDV